MSVDVPIAVSELAQLEPIVRSQPTNPSSTSSSDQHLLPDLEERELTFETALIARENAYYILHGCL